ncbi:achaete-scute homolog 1-like [Mercenaria mercenaria]|uniref:achaete-scute homolog 1-like n=1 Tax=Mercenaria mercenaria TaxID=6596 RepID=UPI00234EE74A|nr:achaete-scute homolog 1-like [Mercenaria mercenaria]
MDLSSGNFTNEHIMKQEYHFQTELQNMPSCMYDQHSQMGVMPSSGQSTRSKLFRFHMAKENAAMGSCRRRLDFNQSCQTNIYGLKLGQQITVARRNERERNRVKLINMTFATLREHLPFEPENTKNKKMSKVDTLKAAIDYIKYLQELVDNHDAVSAVFNEACSIDAMQFDLRTCPTNSPEKSPPETVMTSEATFDALSTEEEELLDFASWF